MILFPWLALALLTGAFITHLSRDEQKRWVPPSTPPLPPPPLPRTAVSGALDAYATAAELRQFVGELAAGVARGDSDSIQAAQAICIEAANVAELRRTLSPDERVLLYVADSLCKKVYGRRASVAVSGPALVDPAIYPPGFGWPGVYEGVDTDYAQSVGCGTDGTCAKCSSCACKQRMV